MEAGVSCKGYLTLKAVSCCASCSLALHVVQLEVCFADLMLQLGVSMLQTLDGRGSGSVLPQAWPAAETPLPAAGASWSPNAPGAPAWSVELQLLMSAA